MKKNIETLLIILIFLLLFVFLLTFPKDAMESVSFSISIWKDNLFPSLFPFLIITYLFMHYKISLLFSEFTKPVVTRFFHLPSSCGFTIMASLFSGFPSNAKFIKMQLDNQEITKEEAEYLLKFCFFSSPLFVLGTVGALLLVNKTLGFFILISHYLGAFITALLLRPKKIYPKEKRNYKKVFRLIKKEISTSSFVTVLKDAIKNAFDILFMLLGMVTIFLVLTNYLTKLLPLDLTQKAILSGLLEMTQGVKNVSLLNYNGVTKAFLMLAIISFGGISVHLQIFSILDDFKISYFKFIMSRLFHIFFSILVLSFFLFIFSGI